VSAAHAHDLRLAEVQLPGGRVAFSTRRGGVSSGAYESLNLGFLTGDEPQRVRRNRELLASDLGLAADRIATGRQIHGAEIADWHAPPVAGWAAYASPRDELPPVDGHFTGVPGLGLLVLVADCLPVALVGGGAAAMLHCGWRGLAAGIIRVAVDRFDVPPAAAIGPGIGRCCFEVGEEVLEAFADVEGMADGRMLDLRGVVEARLRARGVERIDHIDYCTSCRADLFFSHRRDGGVSGRQSGTVWLTP